jgi:hypothetical protein
MSTPVVSDSVDAAASVAAQAATVAVAEKNPADTAASSSEITNTAEGAGSSSGPAKSSSEGSGGDKSNSNGSSSSSSSSSSNKLNNGSVGNSTSGDGNNDSRKGGQKDVPLLDVNSNAMTSEPMNSSTDPAEVTESSYVVRLMGGQEIRINRKELLEENFKFMRTRLAEKEQAKRKLQREMERLDEKIKEHPTTVRDGAQSEVRATTPRGDGGTIREHITRSKGARGAEEGGT